MYLPKPNETEFELAPAGTYLAVCYRVIDLGTQKTAWMGKPKETHKIMISWELPEERMKDGRPFMISQRYTWSMDERATLRKHLEAWRGATFTDADFGEAGFNVKNVLGKSCILTITHTIKDAASGKVYANISSIGKLMKGMQPPAAVNEQIYLWLAPGLFDAETFHKLSQGLQTTIMMSPEYQFLSGPVSNEPPMTDAQHRDDMDESIPF